MATINVSCLFCGAETLGTIPRDAKLQSVKHHTHEGDGNSTATCQECKKGLMYTNQGLILQYPDWRTIFAYSAKILPYASAAAKIGSSTKTPDGPRNQSYVRV